MYLIVLVVNDPYLCKDVVGAWKDAGVSGAILVESLNLKQVLGGGRDNLPLMPTFEDFESGEECRNRTVFSVVSDQEAVNRMKDVTEAVLGPLEEKKTGFMFVVQVSEVFGL